MDWEWVGSHGPLFVDRLREHIPMSVLPVLFGLLISLPMGIACVRWPRLYPPILALTSVLYALPSIALFASASAARLRSRSTWLTRTEGSDSSIRRASR